MYPPEIVRPNLEFAWHANPYFRQGFGFVLLTYSKFVLHFCIVYECDYKFKNFRMDLQPSQTNSHISTLRMHCESICAAVKFGAVCREFWGCQTVKNILTDNHFRKLITCMYAIYGDPPIWPILTYRTIASEEMFLTSKGTFLLKGQEIRGKLNFLIWCTT
jgi:hypothetical protein